MNTTSPMTDAISRKQVMALLKRADLAHHEDATYVHLASALEEIAALPSQSIPQEGEIERLRAALEPFAKLELWTDTYPDGPLDPSNAERRIPAEWIVAARASLKPERQ